MSEEAAARSLLQFLRDVGDAPEVVWAASLAMLERALLEAREARYGRFRVYPAGQLRRLRTDVAAAMKLARLGVAMQEAETERDRELDADLHARAVAAGAARRRAQTLPAELARLAKAERRRQAGTPRTNFHLEPGYPAHGSDVPAEDGDGAGDGGQ